MAIEITVKYWRGTTQHEGKATDYAGAMELASKNQNAFPATFYHEGRKLADDGNGLAYEDKLEQGVTEYAV